MLFLVLIIRVKFRPVVKSYILSRQIHRLAEATGLQRSHNNERKGQSSNRGGKCCVRVGKEFLRPIH